ncbi:MAG: hypothetical protein KDB63_04140 [Nocardioidaceae bacterium]|nr:hypothetical protein [Nocardioidaceae bacterium]
MRRLTLLTGLILSFALVAGATPAVAKYEPPAGATFNTPRPWGTDAERYKIVRTIEAAIRHVSPTKQDPKPFVLVTSYLFDRRSSVDALIGACKRGVSVRVILDEDIINNSERRLVKALNGDNVKDRNGDGKPDTKPRTGKCGRPLPKKDASGNIVRDKVGRVITQKATMSFKQARASVLRPNSSQVTWGKDGSYVKRCDGSCRGPGGNMHSKFYVFSHTGTAKNVVMVSSSNLNRGGALLGWNDLFVMKSRPKSVQAYKAIHLDMTDDIKAPVNKVEVVDGPYTSRWFPMRKASKKNDPTLQDLNKVKCTSAIGRTQINVSMFYWKGVRGDYIADKLLALAGQGCSVNIVYGAPSRAIAARLRAAAGNHRINLYDSRWDFDDNGEVNVRTHAKFILVKGTVGKDRSSWQVWTGTQNWVSGSLNKGDENSLNINLRSAYNKYLADWVKIRNHSRRLPYSLYPPPPPTTP